MFTTITGLPTNFNNQAVGINSAATPWIVGFYQPDAGLTTSFGYLDVGGTITTIDPFGSTFTQALGVNDLGEIVGFYTDATAIQHGYIDNGGVFTSFDPPGSVSTTINGLNDKGDIVGFYTSASADAVIGFVGTPVPEPSTWAMMLAWLRGVWFPRLSQGAPGNAGGLSLNRDTDGCRGPSGSGPLFSRPSRSDAARRRLPPQVCAREFDDLVAAAA